MPIAPQLFEKSAEEIVKEFIKQYENNSIDKYQYQALIELKLAQEIDSKLVNLNNGIDNLRKSINDARQSVDNFNKNVTNLGKSSNKFSWALIGLTVVLALAAIAQGIQATLSIITFKN